MKRNVSERYDKGVVKMVKKRGAPFGNKNAIGNKGGAPPLGNMNAVNFGFNIDYGYRLMMASIEEKLISEGKWSVEKMEEIAKAYRGKPH